jgi:hypothetical protein
MFGQGLLALMAVVMVLALPLSAGARTNFAGAPARGVLGDHTGGADGGSCSEADETPELIECTGDIEWSLDEPTLIALMRSFDVRMSEVACDELLRDIWSQQACEAGSRDCGKLDAGAPPAPTPRVRSSSASARMSLEQLGLLGASCRRLALIRQAFTLDSRDLPPPVPPPKLARH